MFVLSLPQCDSMTLSSTPTVRRGSTPLPIKHQLRREEAVRDDCEWTPGAVGASASPISFSPAVEDTLTAALEGRHEGPLRIALLGQNGVGKSSLALALAGDMDRTASVDSEGTVVRGGVCLTVVTVSITTSVSQWSANRCSPCPQGRGTCARSLWTRTRAPSLSTTTGDR